MIKNCRKLAKYWVFSLILGLFSALGGGVLLSAYKLNSALATQNLNLISTVKNLTTTQSNTALDFSSLQKFANLSNPVTFDGNAELTIALNAVTPQSSQDLTAPLISAETILTSAVGEPSSESQSSVYIYGNGQLYLSNNANQVFFPAWSGGVACRSVAWQDGDVRTNISSLASLDSTATILHATKTDDTIVSTITTNTGTTTIVASADAEYILGEDVTGSNQLIYVSGESYRIVTPTVTAENVAQTVGISTKDVPSARILIFSKGEMTINSTTYTGPSSGGRCIYQSGGTLTISGCTFDGFSTGYSQNGGAIYLSNGTLNITNNTTFKNCQSFSGGALFVAGGYANITSCTITGCESLYGGGIYISGGDVNLTSANITANTALSGEAIYNYGGTCTLNAGNTISTSGTYAIINANTLALAGDSTITGATASICLDENSYITVDASISKNYSVYKENMTSYDDTTENSSIIAYSTNATYLQNFLNNLTVTNLNNYILELEGNYIVVEEKGAKLILNVDCENVQKIAIDGYTTLSNLIPLLDSSWSSNDEYTCGWFLDADLTHVADLNQTITETTTLYTKLAYYPGCAFVKSDDGTCYYITGSEDRYGANPSAVVGDIVLPNTYKGTNDDEALPVQLLGNYYNAFSGCVYMESVTLNANCTSIPQYAFLYCTSLTSINMPEGLTSIGDSAFYQCASLTSITLPGSLGVSYSNNLFGNCTSLENITISEGITFLRLEWVNTCTSLRYIYFPDTMQSISELSTSHKLAVYIPNGCGGTFTGYNNSLLIFYGGTTFNGTVDNATVICGVARDEIDLTADYITRTVDGEVILYAYNGNDTDVVIPSNITTIYSNAFSGCTNVSSVYIPSSVTTISASSYSASPFYGCSSSLKIYCEVTEDNKPSDWGTYWNYYTSGKTLTAQYNVTRADYEAGNVSFTGDGSAVSELVGLSDSNSIVLSENLIYRTNVLLMQNVASVSASSANYNVAVAQIEEPTDTVTAYVEQEKKYLAGAVLNKKLFGNDDD